MSAERVAASADGRRGPVLAVVALSLVLAFLAAAGVVLGLRVADRRSAEDRRQAVVAAARQEAVNFVSIDHRTLDRDIARVLAGATGDFKAEYAKGAAQVTDLVKRNKATSKGEVLDAGVVSATARKATVLLVVDSTVTNTGAPKGQVRHYRISMDLTRTGGTWLASSLEFVG